MRITFHDDPSQAGRAPEDVEIDEIDVTVYPDGRRVAVSLAITPFQQRPSLELTLTNAHGQPAASLTVIEALETTLALTLHLRDKQPTDTYELLAEVYYLFPDRGRLTVSSKKVQFTVTPGLQ
jgi:virulence-associated protein VagC